jgi:hypothetical protein
MANQEIQDKYIDFVLRNGETPKSVYIFAQDNGITEAQFYQDFTSFQAIENSIWKQIITTTIDRLHADESYAAYTVREKILAFYFTILEELLAKRSFVAYSYKQVHLPKAIPSGLSHSKDIFKKWSNELVTEGIEKGEMVQRPMLTERYADGMWTQFLFIIHYWLRDTSQQFEKTDAAVEKAVNLSMDLMGHNTLDTAFDFAKFLIQKN